MSENPIIDTITQEIFHTIIWDFLFWWTGAIFWIFLLMLFVVLMAGFIWHALGSLAFTFKVVYAIRPKDYIVGSMRFFTGCLFDKTRNRVNFYKRGIVVYKPWPWLSKKEKLASIIYFEDWDVFETTKCKETEFNGAE